MTYFERLRRCGLRNRFLLVLVLWIIGFLLALLAPILGFGDAFQFIMVGLGFGALLSWLTAGLEECGGQSGSPRFRRAHFFNENPDADIHAVEIHRKPTPTGTYTNPTIPIVPSGQVNSAPVPATGYFFADAQRVHAWFSVPGSLPTDPPTWYDFEHAVNATDAANGDKAESIDIAATAVPGTNQMQVSAILLHKQSTTETNYRSSTFTGTLGPGTPPPP